MNKTLTILVCIMVAGVVVGASLPIFDSLTASSESVHNEGAGWVRFALDRNAGTTYSLSYTSDDDGFYIDNGTDRQTYDDSSTVNFDTILYADSNLSVWVDGAIHILGTNEGNPVYLEGSDSFTIVRDAEGVTLSSEGTDLARFGVPTWAYIPVSTGNYGFFYAADLDDELGNGVKNYPSDMPLAVVGGGFAGVYAYNDIYRYNGLGLNMHPVYDDDGLFYGAYWDKTAPVEPESLNPDVLDPAVIDLDPIDIDLDPLDPGAQIMNVPTPTYTDGDWGYDLTQVDGVDKAIIVSYSGVGNIALTIPATVGGYDVYKLGKGSSMEVFDQNTSFTSITISDGIEIISNSAFMGSKPGQVSIPNSVTTIEKNAFYYSFISGDLILPDSVTYVGDGAFQSCSSLTGTLKLSNNLTYIGSQAFSGTKFTGTVIIPSSVVTIKDSAFRFNSNLTNLIIVSDATPGGSNTFNGTSSSLNVLDLSTVTYAPGTYGLNINATVYDSIGDCFGFVSVVDVSGSGGSPTQTLIAMLPLIMVLGLVLMAVGIFIWNRM